MTPEQEKSFDEFYSPTDSSRDGNICITLPSKPAIRDFISSLLKEERERVRQWALHRATRCAACFGNEGIPHNHGQSDIADLLAFLALTPDTNQTDL